ncbi:hypothetical protein VTK26DRAFT_8303 [Humicola hyalothermophila]
MVTPTTPRRGGQLALQQADQRECLDISSQFATPSQIFWFNYALKFVEKLFERQITPQYLSEFVKQCLQRLSHIYIGRIGQIELWATHDDQPRVEFIDITKRYEVYLRWDEDTLLDMEEAFEHLFQSAIKIAEAMRLSEAQKFALKGLQQIVDDKLADLALF